ncbi:hypothetical protein NW762_005579 [Fusarium torreyae]|uniref:IRG-type G domain-containing protein n=1 Tax=Fusarium torreyae TaxID=1237075 RepID=A0A9W8VG91_9HYPO|nr:hypothetical protein NW762_005579 [Fusarium torreyae]
MSHSSDDDITPELSIFDTDATGYFDHQPPITIGNQASWASPRSNYEFGSMNFNPRTGTVEIGGPAGVLGGIALIGGMLAGMGGGGGSSDGLVREYRKEAREATRRAENEEKERKEAEKRASEAEAEKEATLERLKLEEELHKLGIPPSRVVSDEEIRTSRLDVSYVNNMCNIGVVGRQNEGKSTLVNCFRGLDHNAPGSAMTGKTEVTRKSTPYADNLHNGVVWHDISGGGTTQTTAWGYYYEQKLFAYDKLVLTHSSTLSELDVQILQVCKHRKQECIVVRTKADAHIRNCKRRCNHETIEKAREDFINQVRQDTIAKNEEAGKARELCPEYTDYIVSEMGIAQLVKGQAPSGDPYEQVIDEESLLRKLRLLS